MRIGFYSPYLDSMAGGERYVLSLAAHWSRAHDVSIFWDDAKVVQKAGERLHLDLTRVHVVRNIFATKSLFTKLLETRTYDLIFFLTDGSIPTSLARKNILHFQVPFTRLAVNQVKMSRFRWIVCNSRFTKDHLDPRLGKRATVIYPPVDMQKAGKKEKLILSVGRFNGHYRVKKQDILLRAWKTAVKDPAWKGWTLVLAGGMLPSDEAYLAELKKQAKGLPVRFETNIAYDKLAQLYGKASIYWHAAGFGETKPEHMEHFGITTVEAMSAGCVPLVYAAGGQVEIVRDGVSGYFWKTEVELIAKTKQVLENTRARAALAKQAAHDAKAYAPERFYQSFDALILP